jgi:hypothetical protein
MASLCQKIGSRPPQKIVDHKNLSTFSHSFSVIYTTTKIVIAQHPVILQPGKENYTMSIDPNETGETRSSRNAVRYGLYTFHDFIREGEDREYSKTLTALMAELSPEGILEETFATQIMTARWRLRRCGLVEFDLAANLDPMAAGPEELQAEKTQKSVDRARAQAFSLLRRSLAELRKLQSERTLETETVDEHAPAAADPLDPPVESSFCKPAETPAEIAPPSDGGVGGSARPGRDSEAERSSAEPVVTKESIARPYPNSDPSEDRQPLVSAPAVSTKVPRNAPCPCGSRQKYKRCCGFSSTPANPPANLKDAA